MAQETTAIYAFGVPLYLGLIALEARVAHKRGRPTAELPESLGNLSAGLGTVVLGLFLGPVLIGLYSFGLAHLAQVRWPSGAWQPWILALILADFGHYWHHRFDHRVAACWAVHGVHHQPQQLNFTVAIRHAWFSDLYSFPFYVPVVVVGVPPEIFFVATTLLSFHALIKNK
jgi:alkylglycerol monooxygenase